MKCMRWAYSPHQFLILMGLGWEKSGYQPWSLALFFRNDVQKVPISYVFLHIIIYCLSTLPFGYEIYEMGLFTFSILITHGPEMGKSWVPALRPGTFFNKLCPKSANLLFIS